MRKLIINEKTSQLRCALYEDDELVEIHYEQNDQKEMAGNIYKARVVKVLPGMQAAFVNIGLDRNGYLHRNDLVSYQLADEKLQSKKTINHFIHEGEELLVQVVKEGTDHKGPKLTTNIEFGGEFLVYKPYGNYLMISKKVTNEEERNRLLSLGEKLRENEEGLLFRTACINKEEKEIIAEYEKLKQQFLQMKSEQAAVPKCVFKARDFLSRILNEVALLQNDIIICDKLERAKQLKKYYQKVEYFSKKEQIFSYYQLDQEIDKLLKRIVWLKNGAYIIIEQTEAMVVIDVNTGKFSGKLSMRETVLKTNEEAAAEIAKQIRLRNLSGMILIDFIDMKHEEDRRKILHIMERITAKDRTQTKLFGFTELNIFQLTRKKIRQPLEKELTEKCPVCQGIGHLVSNETVAFKLERELWEYEHMIEEAIWIEASVGVASLFNEQHIKRLEQTFGFKLRITTNDSISAGYYIRHIGDLSTIEERMNKL
ncbi:Rne/Rng family ribonuclease [Metabacillus fastidiosus]|uniref:Rne/Rng family ribonuclease n=1 Tax=Metabacillus fastidiosus TaxID=1458 RepID=UPI002DB618D2|nr:Rne/Rng family ribonuclease [Metabacillus fastidiosus]MEC2076775.1 Rne/Rng family ribonuclease [Metabacillus fastidiosus]